MCGTAFDPGLTPEIRTITVPYKLKGEFSVLSKVMTLALSARSLEKVLSTPTKLNLTILIKLNLTILIKPPTTFYICSNVRLEQF